MTGSSGTMRSQVRSKTFRVAKQLAKATFLRFGLELNRTGTQDRLKSTRNQLKSARNRLEGAQNRLKSKRNQLKSTRNQLKSTQERFSKTRRSLEKAQKLVREQRYWQPADLRKHGLSPRTIVDVGVDDGTPALYEAFPEAFYVLIEPLKENEPHLQRILQKYEGEYFLTAVGARDEELTINVESVASKKSSIHTRIGSTSTGDTIEKRRISVTTLDALLEKHDFRPPFGLKVDTEGFEYQVIEGATRFLRETQFVIAEVNVAKNYEGSYSFAEFVEIMDENGFHLYDILHAGRGSLKLPSSELLYIDAVFRRADVEHVKGGG